MKKEYHYLIYNKKVNTNNMKKFTEKESNNKHYANNSIIKNEIYSLIEETLTAKIDNSTDNVTLNGKSDLVEELMKITENSLIDSSINLIKNYSNNTIPTKKDSLMEAFNHVNETALNEISSNDISNDKEYQEKINNIFNKYQDMVINYKSNNSEQEEAKLDINVVWNYGQLTVYVNSTPNIMNIGGYKHGIGQSLKMNDGVKISNDNYSELLKLINDISQYVQWNNKYTQESIKTLENNLY